MSLICCALFSPLATFLGRLKERRHGAADTDLISDKNHDNVDQDGLSRTAETDPRKAGPEPDSGHVFT